MTILLACNIWILMNSTVYFW